MLQLDSINFAINPDARVGARALNIDGLKTALNVADKKDIKISDLVFTYIGKDHSVSNLFIGAGSVGKITKTKITSFEQFEKAYMDNRIYVTGDGQTGKMDITSSPISITIKPLKKADNKFYITDKYEGASHAGTIRYGKNRIMDVTIADVADKKNIFKTSDDKPKYLYLKVKGAEEWDYYPVKDLVYYEGSAEPKKLSETDFSRIDVTDFLNNHQIYFKEGNTVKLVEGMLTSKTFGMQVHQKDI